MKRCLLIAMLALVCIAILFGLWHKNQAIDHGNHGVLIPGAKRSARAEFDDRKRSANTEKIAKYSVASAVDQKNKRPKKIEEYFYDSARDGSLSYSFLGQGWRITTAAVEAAQMSETERKLVQDTLNSTIHNAEESIVSRMRTDETHTDAEIGVYAFDIPASPNRASGILEDFHSQIVGVLGKSRGEILCKSFDIDYSPIGMNRYDVRLTVQVASPEEKKLTLVKYEVTNPETGKVSRRGESSIQAFKGRFGDIIDFPE